MDDDAGRASEHSEDGEADAGGETEPGAASPDPQGSPAFAVGSAKGLAIRDHWEEFIDDVEATGAEFRERGWEVLELHPGDVTVVDADRRGFDVLVPDDEFEQLREWVETGEFDEHDVYLASTAIVFVLVVLRDDDAERAVCCPLYYGSGDVETLHSAIENAGHLATHVRRLSNDYVTFVHGDPLVFFPDDGE